MAPAPLLAELARVTDTLLTPPAPGSILLIGRRHMRSNNSWMHNSARLMKGRPRCNLLMNPTDLAARGLIDGQMVLVRSRIGSIEVEVTATDNIMPGVASLPHGWGHGRPGVRLRVAAERPGVSINDLTDNGLPVTVEAADLEEGRLI
jgi:anaerobic selenocysteine-containing dehydrogenase